MNGRFQLNGKEVFLRSGEYHYFRVDPESWEGDLKLLKKEGKINVISTYVPWIFHEIYENFFDFTGETNPRRDLRKFLDICRKVGLPVIFRPGPFIYSEYPGFGIPLWIGELYPEVIVKRVDGSLEKYENYFNVSLNHPKYIELVSKWYAKLKEEFQDYFEDPIIIFQLDNETGLMYNYNVGRVDFNESTIKYFQQWLEEVFGDPQTLSVYCVESYLSFEEVLPPKDGLNVAKTMIWQSFLEDWIIKYLETLIDIASELDIPLVYVINEQSNQLNPSNPVKKAPLVEIYGYTVNTKTSRIKAIHDNPFRNSITPSIFKGYLQEEYQPLFASELGCGWFDPKVKVKLIATVQAIMGSIAHGAKGLNLYMTRDGEDLDGNKYYYKGLINHKGKKLKRLDAVKEIFSFIEKTNDELLASEEIYDEIAFATYAMNHRTIPGDFDQSGQNIRPIKVLTMLAEYGILGYLFANGYNPKPIALEKVSLKEMRRLKTIFFHNRGAIIKADYTKLLDYVKGGGHLVTGPNFPVMNEYGFPLNTQKLYPAVVTKERIFGKSASVFRLLSARINLLLKRRQLRRYNRNLNYHLERNERLNVLRSWRPKGTIATTKEGRKIRVDYLVREFIWQKEGIETFLRVRNRTIGYRHTLGKGTNTIIGTPLGARYVIDAFYHDSKKIKKQNREFLEELLHKNNVKKTFDTSVELEIVGRVNKEKKSLFLFLLNRGKKKEGTIKFLIPAKTGLPKNQPLKIELLYSYFGSALEQKIITIEQLEQKGLPFKIKRDDCLVLRLSPKNRRQGKKK
ncbi:MAG: hypothetical protein DRP02_05475 [Candidatus Gerdarchaeota archaeon]|nr:MAG: hypothetical protein DRP02_05475 [Candidatus Gerdarchaeota archaeon]